MIKQLKRRWNMEMYDFHEFIDRVIAALCLVACVLILLFTGAGEILWDRLLSYVATWGM